MSRRLLARVLSGASLAALLIWEWRRPLRAVHESRFTRDTRNILVAGAAALAVQAAEMPVAHALLGAAERRRWGLARHLPLPPMARFAVSLLLFDYSMYLWHVWTHRSPFLWRFHQVHHIDREMDATTALRFHFGEMLLSVPLRALQIRLIGPDRRAYTSWQSFLFTCILFHHSNARLPLAWERRLARIIVTPRLHGIHHSVAPEDVNSNWSSGLTVWDWLHGTLRTDKPQRQLTLGVRNQRTDFAVQLPELLAIPFNGTADVPAARRESLRQSLRQSPADLS